jgi:hypothetical protein
VLFVASSGLEILEGVIIEHMHRNNYQLVEVPTITDPSDYYEVQLFWLSDGNWLKIDAQCGQCKLYVQNDKTPTINQIFPGNSMSPFQTGFWTAWKSLDTPEGTVLQKSFMMLIILFWEFCFLRKLKKKKFRQI